MPEVEMNDPCEATAPIVLKNEEQRIVYGPVAIPDEPDSDGDIITKAKIEQVAHGFLKEYGNIDLQHTLNNVGIPVESYIAPVNLQFGAVTVPKGSWMMGVYVSDDATWQAVKNGELAGFSLMGIRKSTATSATKSDQASYKRTMLKDLGEDWVVPYVSLVDSPAVPKAKFVSIKSQEEKPPTFFDKVAGIFSSKAGKTFSDSNYTKLKNMSETLMSMLEEAEKERSEKQGGTEVEKTEVQAMIEEALKAKDDSQAIKAAVEAAIEPLTARLAQVEKAEAPEETEATKAEAAEPDAEVEALKAEVEALKAFKASVETKLQGKPASGNALKGQDGEPTKAKVESNRDGFGRSTKNRGGKR